MQMSHLEQMDWSRINIQRYIWGEWPSGLRHCNQNEKIPGSNPTGCLAGLRNPTLLCGS